MRTVVCRLSSSNRYMRYSLDTQAERTGWRSLVEWIMRDRWFAALEPYYLSMHHASVSSSGFHHCYTLPTCNMAE